MKFNFNKWLKAESSFSNISIVEQDDTFESGGYVVKLPITNSFEGLGVNLGVSTTISNIIQDKQPEMNALIGKVYEVEKCSFINSESVIAITVSKVDGFSGDRLFEEGSLIEIEGAEPPAGTKWSPLKPNINKSFIVKSCVKESSKYIVKVAFKADYAEDKDYTGTINCSHNDMRVLISAIIKGIFNGYEKVGPGARSGTFSMTKKLETNPLSNNNIKEVYTISFLKKIKQSDNLSN
tara:strand:+ start:5555 stop:6265 length:711 start_codon:yes stop_codon:yes gene_type:complete